MKYLIFCFLFSYPLWLMSATWDFDGDGDWNINGNWTLPATFPNGADAVADFSNVITSNTTVTLGEDITVGTVSIDDNNAYFIDSASNSLTFDVTAGVANFVVTKLNGSAPHDIQCPVILESDLAVNISSDIDINITGDIISGIGSLTLDSGALRLGGVNAYGGTTTVNGGRLIYDINGAIPPASAVTVGDVSPNTILTINIFMTPPSAFALTLNDNGKLDQNPNRSTRLRSLSGSGEVQKSTAATNGNRIDIIGGADTTFSGKITGGSTSTNSNPAVGNRLLKNSSSTLKLTNFSDYSCRTFIQNGVINAQHDDALGASGVGSAVYVQAAGTLEIETGINLLKDMHLNGTGFSLAGAIHNVSGDNTISGPVAIGWSGGTQTAANATIQVDSGTSLTLSDQVTGSNALTLIGDGILRFSGTAANEYTGDTIINGGTLDLNKTGVTAIVGDIEIDGGTLLLSQTNQIADTSAMTLTSGTFNLDDNNETIGSLTFNGGTLTQGVATLTLDDGTAPLTMRDVTISGSIVFSSGGTVAFDETNGGAATISGTINEGGAVITYAIANGAEAIDMLISGVISNGGLTKTGAGTLELTGGNFYVGGTTVSAGTLQGNTTSLQGDIINNATLVFNQGVAGTYAGALSGSGALTKQGTGVLTLTGTNLYLGGTTVSAGTLQGNALSLQGDIINNATLVFNQGVDGTYGGDLTGSGALTKQGTGNLNLTGINTVGGVTTVSAGTMRVNGSLGGDEMISVAAGATLRGVGSIAKDLFVSGTLFPGNSIGVITIVGDVTFLSGSFLEIELDSTTSDLVDITGLLTIDPGATLVITPDPGTMPLSEYLIVDTTDGVFGTFTTVTSLFPLFESRVIYTATQILLQEEMASLNFPDFGGNAGQVEDCLNSFLFLPETDISNVAIALLGISSTLELEKALLQLQPSAFTAVSLAQETNTLAMRSALYHRCEENLYASCFEQDARTPFSLWATGLGGWSCQGNRKKEPGYRMANPGAVAGFDASPFKGVLIGGGGSYQHTRLYWKDKRGFAKISTAAITTYGQWIKGYGFLEGALIGSYYHLNQKRRIQFGSIRREAKSRHHGFEGSAHFKGGFLLSKKHFKVTPFAKLDYLYLHEKGYQEEGAGSLNLEIKAKSADLLVSGGGLNLSSCLNFKGVTITPFAQLTACWENRFFGKEIKSLFNDCPLKVKGINPSRMVLEYESGLYCQDPSQAVCVTLIYKGKYATGLLDSSIYFELQTKF